MQNDTCSYMYVVCQLGNCMGFVSAVTYNNLIPCDLLSCIGCGKTTFLDLLTGRRKKGSFAVSSEGGREMDGRTDEGRRREGRGKERTAYHTP